tara:strand:+ start:968 stop:1078 length:111 start_codon:yes stop_codon:yes gene_type:complete
LLDDIIRAPHFKAGDFAGKQGHFHRHNSLRQWNARL